MSPPAKAALQVLRGLLVGRPVMESWFSTLSRSTFGPSPAVHGIKLGKGLHRDPEGYPSANHGGGVIRQAWNGSSAGFIDQKEHRPATFALGAVVGRDQLVNEPAVKIRYPAFVLPATIRA
jgi:hypothetical protein